MAVPEEKIQERSPIFQQPVSLPENAQTLAGTKFGAAGKLVKNFPAASKFARKLLWQGISDSHSLLEFSEYLFISVMLRNGQSTVGGPKWTKMDLFRPNWTKMDHFGPFLVSRMLKSSSE